MLSSSESEIEEKSEQVVMNEHNLVPLKGIIEEGEGAKAVPRRPRIGNRLTGDNLYEVHGVRSAHGITDSD